ncbi:MAG: pyridoxamine 5'-phosphate oxidase family protein [Lachnospiraceae bacterium]|nr:pyridoxamine 5'-phosphate oxidase family protein [Lachnospiraceae bacterium]
MRRRDREITDPKEIDEIIENCLYLHLGLVDEGKPYVIPMNYGVIKDETDGHYIIFLHCANEGRKLDIIKKNPICCFTMERNTEPFEGRVACQYGMTYECIMGTGNISFVEEPEEKISAMLALMETQTKKRDFQFDERMLTIVTVLRIDVDSLTAKRRPAPGTEG